MIKKFLPFSSLLFVALLSSCYYDNEEELYPFDNCNLPQEVSYAADVEPIISGSCAVSGCHITGGEGNGVFDSYQSIKEKYDNGTFQNRVLQVGDMAGPSYGNLSDCEVETLRKWVEQGAPNN
ncbi:hypothetical protein [Halocola ammonii]